MSRPVPTRLLGAASGCIVANIYYAQPIVAIVGHDLRLDTTAAALLVTLTQFAYGAGLLFLAPLGDIVENRRLVVLTTLAVSLSAALAAVAPNAALFAVACVCIGFSAVAVQMIVPLAAHLAAPERRGAVVGTVMSGLVLGLVLARPVASVVTHYFGWRWVFGGAAVLSLILAVALGRGLERREPDVMVRYGKLAASLWPIYLSTGILRRRAFYQAMLFGAFSLFWTAAPIVLARDFGVSQLGIALFGLAGAAGAAAAPIAGRLADRGQTRVGTAVAMVLVALGFAIAWLGRDGAFAAFVIAGIVIDLGVQANLVFGQRALYALDAERRSRYNSLYMATFFLGGACGSALAGAIVARGGWVVACAVGAGAAICALAALGIFEPSEARATKKITRNAL